MSNRSESRGLTRLSNSINQHDGARVRMRRLILGMSQIKLAGALGVSSKHVQEYEMGIDQISASHQEQFSRVLRVPLPYFFRGGGPLRMVLPSPLKTPTRSPLI